MATNYNTFDTSVGRIIIEPTNFERRDKGTGTPSRPWL